jgi:hypothetical protein
MSQMDDDKYLSVRKIASKRLQTWGEQSSLGFLSMRAPLHGPLNCKKTFPCQVPSYLQATEVKSVERGSFP